MHPRIPLRCSVLALFLSQAVGAVAQTSISDTLSAPGVDLRDAPQRERAQGQVGTIMADRHAAARAKALQMGLPVRTVHPNGRVVEIADFVGDRPLYFTTHNVNAAISSGANLLRLAPYSVSGSGLTVGVWDGGGARTTHQEFGTRVTIKDGAALVDHSTHVAGTIGAVGVDSLAKGMAPSVNIDSYEWTSDKSEMTGRGASYPGEAGKIYLSNHSYGIVSGWYYTGLASPRWAWYGNGTTSTSFEPDFGKYETNARDTDSLAFSLPYYLIMRSAGNERVDNPAAGDPVSLTTSTTSAVTYDAAVHPTGDGTYRNGYDTISYDAIAKNVVTVGSVGDAVSGSTRSLSGAYMSSYSSWGPTDDGRIKPDLVANGEYLYSTLSTANNAYGYMSGTSMATPSATGSAALVVNYWNTLCPGHALRASTLKGLLIHTADDLGTSGPDYQFGWGLINVQAAADVLQAYKTSAGTRRVVEDRLTTTKTTSSYNFTWNGSSAIRATLCWTDPAGAFTTSTDLRTARLVNNLDLKITGPTGIVYSPWVMPFVGDWTNAKLSAAAVTGVNNTDNVERVDIATPTNAGAYTVTVTYTGTLTNSAQNFSVLLSGGTATATASAPVATVISPNAGTVDTMTLNLTGSGFQLGANVKLTKSGQAEVVASNQEIRSDNATFRVNVNGMASGLWNVVLTNPDGQSTTLPTSFSIAGALWQDNLEAGASGWSHSATAPYTTDSWALTTAQSSSPTHSFFAGGPGVKNIDDLYSPIINVPADAANLSLTFMHNFDLQSTRDGGVLEFSVNGGAWFDVTAAGSGAAFASGGYNSSLTVTNPSSSRNPLAGRAAWSGTKTGFSKVAVNLTDAAKYAGKTLQIRWRLATNGSTTSPGWYVDDIAIAGVASGNLPPSITAEAIATPTPVTAASTQLTVSADDDSGESALAYTWSYTGGSFTRPVSFSENGTNAAKSTTATFTVAGNYTFTVSARDAQGLTDTSSVVVTVDQTATSVSVLPATVSLAYGATQNFTASVLDQFSDPLTVQPSLTWSTNGGGTINGIGTYLAGVAGGPYSVTATSGSVNGSSSVTIVKAVAPVSLSNLSQTYNGSPRPVTVTTSPGGLATTATYNNSSTVPTNVGNYPVVVTINDPNYQGTASGTLTIGKGTAAISLTDLTQVYDGNPKPVTVATTPTNLSTIITYNGVATVPSDFGSYPVVATISDANWEGTTSGTLTIGGLPLSTWKTQSFTLAQIIAGDAADHADPDLDGWDNLAEYALGTNPNYSSFGISSNYTLSGLSINFTRPKALPDVIYEAESSPDMAGWSPVPITLISDGPIQTMRATDPLPLANGSRRFMRLKFSR